jgi:hypothetical protein
MADSFYIDLRSVIPAFWNITSTVNGPLPSAGQWSILLNSSESAVLSMNYATNGSAGSGNASFSVYSRAGEAGKSSKLCVHAGANILLVDADQGDNLETYYIDAVKQAGHVPFIYNRYINGPVSSSFMSGFEAVVWFTGTPFYDVLSLADENNLSAYLDGGGNLFLTGSEIGYSIGGGDDTVHTFYTEYLRSIYMGDSASSFNVSGVASDPVSDGLSFSIQGGNGAGNQRYPDFILPINGAYTSFYYGGGSQRGGISYNGRYRLIYLSFGFEGISTTSARNTLMENALNWFGVTTLGTREIPKPKETRIIVSVTPNPFNARTQIDIKGENKAEIYDVSGRLIAKISNEDGTKDKSFSSKVASYIFEPERSGIYLIKTEHYGKTYMTKAICIK